MYVIDKMYNGKLCISTVHKIIRETKTSEKYNVNVTNEKWVLL